VCVLRATRSMFRSNSLEKAPCDALWVEIVGGDLSTAALRLVAAVKSAPSYQSIVRGTRELVSVSSPLGS